MIDIIERKELDLIAVETEWGIVSELTALRPIADRILVLEDEFKSRYDCTECHGKGHLGVKCPWCKGTKYFKGDEEQGYCRDCTAGVQGGAVGRTLGFVLCTKCNGSGGTIVIPDDTKKRPTTGRVIAIGSLVTEFKVGNNILFTNYTGQDFEVDGIKLRVMRQHDVYCERKALNKKNSDSVQVDENSRTDPDNIKEV